MNLKALIGCAGVMLGCLSPAFAQVQIPLTASNASGSPYCPAWCAVDTDPNTVWNSGGPPTQWIELDAGTDKVVGKVNLLTAMYPNGVVSHNVYGRTNAGQWVSLGYWSGWANDNQWLSATVTEPTPVRYIVVQTTASPSWVAWREVQAFEKPDVREVQPRGAGDIVGRDLDTLVFGLFGHLGFFDGEQVMQVMNESPVVQRVSYENFRSKSKPWDAVYTNIPYFNVTSCFYSTCNLIDSQSTTDRITLNSRLALIRRALQIQAIGADYTLTAMSIPADPRMYDRFDRTYIPAQRGRYRCDTYVGDLFAFVTANNAYGGERWMWGSNSWMILERRNDVFLPESWRSNVFGLFNPDVLPVTLYNRFKAL